MDKKLEARVARLEKMLARKNESNGAVPSSSKSLLSKLKKTAGFKVWPIGKDRWLVEDYGNGIFFILLYEPENDPNGNDWWIYGRSIDTGEMIPVKEEDLLQDEYSDNVRQALLGY